MPLQSLNKHILSDYIKSNAKKMGFFDCGISKTEHLPQDAEKMEAWLTNGNNGKMSYLEKNKDKRYNPKLLVENAKSVITVLYNYYPKQKLPEANNYKISKYAYGNDYHYVIKDKLRELLNIIEVKTGSVNARVFTDSAPVLDRAWARKSKLGFIGKNTMLISRKGGSFFFIGHIIIDVELEYEEQTDPVNYCGSCTKCIDACPTNAIKNNFIDARSCISYLTIEYKGDFPNTLKSSFDNWIFGCDICQDVCPWNRFSTPNSEPLFTLNNNLTNSNNKVFKDMDKPIFNKMFKNTALERTGFKGLARNIKYVEEYG